MTPAWLQTWIEDPFVTDILLREGRCALIDKGEGIVAAESMDPGFSLKSWCLEQLSASGKSWSAHSPYIDARLGQTHRLHAIFPPASPDGLEVSLRRLPSADNPLPRRWRDDPCFPIAQKLVEEGASIVIAGATGSGKTSLMNELLSAAPPNQRMIALEDTSELAPRHPLFTRLLSRSKNADGYGEITLSDLLRQTLRMRPDRILLGECRGGEVLELLQLLNTGHRGAMATLHAHSARDALRRIELLCLLGSRGAIPVSVIRDLIASGLEALITVARIDGKRQIVDIARIAGREADTLLLRPLTGSSSVVYSTHVGAVRNLGLR